MPDEISTTPEAVRPASTPVAEVKPEAANTLLDDIKKANKAENPEPDAKKVEATKPEDDEPEPEFTDPKLKNQRDWNLKQAQKLSDEKKAIAEAKAEIEAEKAEIARQREAASRAAKPDDTKKEEIKLQHFVDISDDDIKDENGEVFKDTKLLRDGLRSLAKEIAELRAENAQIKADSETLKGEVLPNELGFTAADTRRLVAHTEDQGRIAAEAIKEEFGIDVDPLNILAATKEFGMGFVNLGVFKASEALEADAMVRCFKHANRNELATLKSKQSEESEEEVVVKKVPPLPSGSGKSPGPKPYDKMTPREQLLADIKKEKANA